MTVAVNVAIGCGLFYGIGAVICAMWIWFGRQGKMRPVRAGDYAWMTVGSLLWPLVLYANWK